jgi:predicted nuclease with TOPRIM domain
MESEHATSWPYEPIGVYDVMQLQDTCQLCRSKLAIFGEVNKDLVGEINTLMSENAELKIRLDNAIKETQQKCWEDLDGNEYTLSELKQKWEVVK